MNTTCPSTNRSRRRPVAGAVATLAALSGVAAIGSPAAAGSEPATEECGGEITVATVAADSGAQGFLADEVGTYEDHGLTVEVKIVAGVPELAAAVQSGDAQFALTSPTSVAAGAAAGLPFVIVAAGVLYTEEAPGTWLMVQDDVETVDDLEGSTIAVNALNTLPHLSTMALLEDNGVDPTAVEFVTQNFPAIGQAMESGAADAGSVVSPFVGQIEADGIGTRFESPYDYVNNKDDFLNTIWFGTSDYIAENQCVAAAFVGAIRDASEWANDEANREDRRAILQEYTELTDDAMEFLELSDYGTEADPQLVQPLLDLMLRFGVLEEPLEATDIIVEL